MRESLRLYPPAWSIGREAAEDLELGGQRFARGTWFWFIPLAMHRDPRWFDQPDRFLPDRWAGDFAKRLPRFAYFRCLATIARHVRLEVVSRGPVELFPAVTLRPKHGLKVRITRRRRSD